MATTLEEEQAMPPAPPAPAAVACQGADRARAEERGNRPRRLAGLLRWAPKNAHSHHDPLFDRPDLVENDYYRFRNHPSG